MVLTKSPRIDSSSRNFKFMKTKLLVFLFALTLLFSFKNLLYVKAKEDINPYQASAEEKDYAKILIDFLNLFLRGLGEKPDQEPETTLPNGDLTTPSSLREFFEEVGDRVKVPPRILEAVMMIETPSTFNLSSEQIKQYSTPASEIPGCGPNVCAAAGPMQITTGVDNQGSPTCSNCCWGGYQLGDAGYNWCKAKEAQGLRKLKRKPDGRYQCCQTSCPNKWAVHKNSVNEHGGFSHTPKVCNLRDNVYAAADKLKKDSGAASPTDWTKKQVYDASYKYYGDCTQKYDRLGSRTYCEYVWWYYNN